MTEVHQERDLLEYVSDPLLTLPRWPLKGRTALITGATRFNGIGFAIAERFALEGIDRLILVGTENSRERATFLEQRLRRYDTFVKVLLGDIRSPESCKEMMQEAYQFCSGNVDILVNNAASENVDRALTSVTEEDWEKIVGTKLKGAVFMTREWFKIRNQANPPILGGSVINNASIVGQEGNYGQTLYAIANGGLIAATKVWALELGRRGINVNAIAPSFVVGTDMTVGMAGSLSVIRDITPLKEGLAREGIVLKPQDVAELAAILAGPGASRMTGQVLTLDGKIGTNYTALDGLKGYQKVPSFASQILEGLTRNEVQLVLDDRAREQRQ